MSQCYLEMMAVSFYLDFVCFKNTNPPAPLRPSPRAHTLPLLPLYDLFHQYFMGFVFSRGPQL